MSRKLIDSTTELPDVDRHFRVVAGPGAGKTTWLVRHIRQVLQRSKRRSSISRVACISFTNVAVQEIQRRLGPSATHVDVATIHSFLYRNVVKPYLHLLHDDQGLPFVETALVDGHDEHHLSFQKFKDWLKACGSGNLLLQPMATTRQRLQDQVSKLGWKWDETADSWSLCVPHPERLGPKTKSLCASESLLRYKRLYWAEGSLDHDDVLYFAQRILQEKPFVREFLSARYRHVFVDEFQDTDPVQTQMIRWLAEHGTIVGVIGDVEQSIYSFRDACPHHFAEFALSNHLDLEIADNWRSTNAIIRLLNKLRADGLEQRGLRNVEGDKVRLVVGPISKCMAHIHVNLPASVSPWVLTRYHDDAERFRDPSAQANDPWGKFQEVDRDRARFLLSLVTGLELARLRHFALAVSTITRGVAKRTGLRPPLSTSSENSPVNRHALAITLLEHLLASYATFSGGTALDAYCSAGVVLETHLPFVSLSKMIRGKTCANFCANTSYQSLAAAR
jgi:DNA helicase-2/ATP-dependent DNA helicase PcrA